MVSLRYILTKQKNIGYCLYSLPSSACILFATHSACILTSANFFPQIQRKHSIPDCKTIVTKKKKMTSPTNNQTSFFP